LGSLGGFGDSGKGDVTGNRTNYFPDWPPANVLFSPGGGSFLLHAQRVAYGITVAVGAGVTVVMCTRVVGVATSVTVSVRAAVKVGMSRSVVGLATCVSAAVGAGVNAAMGTGVVGAAARSMRLLKLASWLELTHCGRRCRRRNCRYWSWRRSWNVHIRGHCSSGDCHGWNVHGCGRLSLRHQTLLTWYYG